MKLLNAAMRLPRMADQLYKAWKRMESAEENKRNEKRAIEKLMPYVNQSNMGEFFDSFLLHLNKSMKYQKVELLTSNSEEY